MTTLEKIIKIKNNSTLDEFNDFFINNIDLLLENEAFHIKMAYWNGRFKNEDTIHSEEADNYFKQKYENE